MYQINLIVKRTRTHIDAPADPRGEDEMERLDRVELQREAEAEVRGNNRPRRTGGLRDGAPPRRGRPSSGPAAPVCVTRGGGGTPRRRR